MDKIFYLVNLWKLESAELRKQHRWGTLSYKAVHNAIFVSRKGAKINFEFKRFKTIDNSQWVFLVSKDVIHHILSIYKCAMKIGNFFPSSIFYKFLKNENVG